MIDGKEPAAHFCAFCGKVMGVYEPLIAIGNDQQARRTSRLSYREAPIPGVLVHEACYDMRQPWREEGAG